jgi:hypothetical protein
VRLRILGAVTGNPTTGSSPWGRVLLMVIGSRWIAWSSRRRFGSELDRCAGAENLTKMVFGPHGDVQIGGLHQHSCLEAIPGKRFH